MRKATDILKRSIGNDAPMSEAIEQESINADIAQLIYDARTAAGLSQMQLAELVGTHQPDISRLESADYDGHSLAMLRRIAAALNRRLVVTMEPIAV